MGEEEPALRLVFHWPGDDFPARQDLEIRSNIEALIAVRGVGRVLSTAGGMGWMDIRLAVENPLEAQRALEEIVATVAPEMKYDIQTGVSHDQ